MEDKCLKEEGR